MEDEKTLWSKASKKEKEIARKILVNLLEKKEEFIRIDKKPTKPYIYLEDVEFFMLSMFLQGKEVGRRNPKKTRI